MYVGAVNSVNAERVPAEAAEAAVGRLREMSPDLRGCALIGPGGEVLAATGEADRGGPRAGAGGGARARGGGGGGGGPPPGGPPARRGPRGGGAGRPRACRDRG